MCDLNCLNCTLPPDKCHGGGEKGRCGLKLPRSKKQCKRDVNLFVGNGGRKASNHLGGNQNA